MRDINTTYHKAFEPKNCATVEYVNAKIETSSSQITAQIHIAKAEIMQWLISAILIEWITILIAVFLK